ncbi:NADP-dependent oxidoreductase [Piscirickettsia litoralis]|uniref:Enoyl reductase (ER) domain-containing protein n=1 Tax=Piscirickettsia litoralis TaxID=1891921 RepID=A0ABX2ZY30_9GAMM|nr:NADP-dependent oxidoreductase [Piscirickettsia litoralis]ODN41524.1 hypothetical protein BGC07_15565 [Piscirickettsia litoralis]
MKAWGFKEFGNTPFYCFDVPEPKLEEGKVIVKTISAGVNPTDWNTKIGIYPYDIFPFMSGWELCGEVIAEKGTQHNVGDIVYGLINFPEMAGCYAEKVSVNGVDVVPIPNNIPAKKAGALPLVGLSVIQAFDKISAARGKSILITGASGGVGHMAVQHAKNYGLHVIAVASSKNEDFVRGLGAGDFIAYDKEEIKLSGDVDILFDIYKEAFPFEAVKNGGQILTLQERKQQEFKNINYVYHVVNRNADDLLRLTKLIEVRKIIPHISSTFPFSEVEQAIRQVSHAHAKGKIIVDFNLQP